MNSRFGSFERYSLPPTLSRSVANEASYSASRASEQTMTDSEVILLFRRPASNANLVQFIGLSPATTHEKITALAAACGPVSHVWLHAAGTSSWANVQFYSTIDCKHCIRELNGCTLDQRRVEVHRLQLSSTSAIVHPMRVAHAVVLMNRFVGPTGWSSSVESMTREFFRAVDGPESGFQARYKASVVVQCGSASVRGESSATRTSSTMAEVLGFVQKVAASNALRAALAQLAIARVGGQVLVEVIEDPMPKWSHGDPPEVAPGG